MSEQAPERGRGGNVFTRRIGPLPMWQWLLIAGAMLGVYVLFQYRKNSQQAASAANTAAGTSTGGTTGAGQVPQFVNQTYTTVSPPSAQPPPPTRHAPGGAPSGTNPLIGTQTIIGGYNAGEYQVGQAQVQLIQQYAQSNQFGVTPGEAADTQQAYNNAVQKYGAAMANTLHFSWIGQGNVVAQSGSQTLGRVL